MDVDPAAVLHTLFAITRERIDRDVGEGERDLDAIMTDTDGYTIEERYESEDPHVMAEHFHRQMARAKVIRSQEAIPEEQKVFFAALAAEHIAEEAVGIAGDKGRLAELSRLLEEIRIREGLDDDDFWQIGEGPEDHEELEREWEKLAEKVRDTITAYTFRRYRLNDIADLYENDRTQFDALRERGRKRVHEMSGE
jgi:hypothetical protein